MKIKKIYKKIKIFLLILILVFLLFSFGCSAKNTTIKSDIKKKIDYLLGQGIGYLNGNQIDKAISTFTEAYELSLTIDDAERIIKTCLKLIETYIHINRPDKAYGYLAFIKKLSEKEKLEQYYSAIFFQYAKYFELIKDFDNAIISYKEAIRTSKKDIDKSIALNGLGLLYLRLNKYDESLTCLNEAYKINKKLKNYIELANNAYNMAQCYFGKKELSKSLEFALEALKYDKISENQYNIFEDLKLIAKIYEFMNDIESAIYYLNKAINIAQVIAKDQLEYLISELQRLQSLLS
ncbi:MAG: tetratricopeptide repeat protein [Exilispira sp.]|jgi:tetratricopeptide (TPR) repeat protein|nr:tetratricopeptide repeat protein [Exilispira sp.]